MEAISLRQHRTGGGALTSSARLCVCICGVFVHAHVHECAGKAPKALDTQVHRG